MIHLASPEDVSGLMWFKSSYSSSEAGDCVEVALAWHRSSYSDSSNGNDCVEIAPTPTTIHIRDSKNPGGTRLTMTPEAWTAFVAFAVQA